MTELDVVGHDLLRSDWRTGLPLLSGSRVELRELRRSDAPALFQIMLDGEVARYLWSPPPSVCAMERFIEASWRERSAGRYAGFAIVPAGSEHAAGLFELRSLQPGFLRAELGFFLERAWWGKAVFVEASRLLREFAFGVLKAHRLEARVSVENVRGNAVMRKLGAQQEGVLRAAFISGGRCTDQYLWAILNEAAISRLSRGPEPVRRP